MTRLRILHITIAAALLGLIVWKSGIGDVRRVLADVNPWFLIAVVFLNIPLAVIYPLRSHLVLIRMDARVPPHILVPTAILGNVAGSLTPASSGELLRTAMLRSHADLAVEDGLALVFYERILSTFVMALGTLVAVVLVGFPLSVGLPLAALALLALALPLAAPSLLRKLPPSPAEAHEGLLRRIINRLRQVAGRLDWILQDRLLLARWSLLTIAMFVVVAFQIWLLSRAVSHAVSPLEGWVAFGASQLAGIASLLPLGLGAADGSLAGLLRRMGTTFEEGTVVAILVRATMTLPMGLAAVLCYVYLARAGVISEAAADDSLR